MIPLIACRAYSVEGWLTAAAIMAAAVGTGWATGRYGAARSAAFALCVGVYVAAASIFRLWPFDPTWLYDCGATPDPNIAPISAALLFPFVLTIAWLPTRRWWRKRDRP